MMACFKYSGLSLVIGLLLALPAAAGLLPGVDRDNGTGPDGVMIFPKDLAMFCDISSADIAEEETVKNCLNKILLSASGSQLGKQDYQALFKKAYRQMNKVYLEGALNYKSQAGDVEDKIDDEIGALDQAGAIPSKEDNIRKKQEQNAALYGKTAAQTVDVIDVYSSLLALNAMKYYYEYEFSGNAAPIEGAEE